MYVIIGFVATLADHEVLGPMDWADVVATLAERVFCGGALIRRLPGYETEEPPCEP